MMSVGEGSGPGHQREERGSSGRALGWPARPRSGLRGKKKKARPLGLSAGEMGLTGVLFFFFLFQNLFKTI